MRFLLLTLLLSPTLVAAAPGAPGSVPSWASPAAPAGAASAGAASAAPLGPGGPPPPPPPVPFDGGLSLLAVSGAGYAARRLRRTASPL